VSYVAAQTHPKRLAGSLVACFGLHSHQLLFASGPLALAAALKGVATVRGMVTAAAAGAAAGGAQGEPAYNILLQVRRAPPLHLL
jgi:stage V sporulation protein SpoVS